MNPDIPTKHTIEEAHKRIKPYVHRTPILTSSSLNEISSATLFFKCENFQKVGAFKARGATNAVLSLDKENREKGVCTHSSGNHAQALAYAARLMNSYATIVMPRNAPKVKKEAVLGYGANVVECEPNLQARESAVQQIVNESGATLIHPYNDYRIIAGQATAAKELLEDIVTPLDFLLAPVGGGGLLSGTALSARYFSPTTKVIGCEPEGADDAFRSFRDRQLYPSENPNTIADGLLTSLGDKTFEIILNEVSDILTVNDDEIRRTMQYTFERMKIVIEPSSAVCLAVVLKYPRVFEGKQIGIIISGGNVGFNG